MYAIVKRSTLLLVGVIMTQPVAAQTTYKVYFLGGQSNMDGFGYVAELPNELQAPVPGVMIFHGNPVADDTEGGGRGVWSQLKPGHGIGFSSDGKTNTYSDRFGVELTFAQRLRQLDPDAKIAIIKYSRGGTSIDSAAAGDFGSWDPNYGGRTGVNQYDHFLTTVTNAMAVGDIDGDGVADELVPAGIVWMQGESDAAEGQGVAYESNLRGLIDRVRLDLHSPKLPFVMGRILVGWGDAVNNTAVRDAQETVGTTVAETTWIDTDSMSTLGGHFDAWGQVELGEAFAAAWYDLQGVGTWTDLGGSLASGALAPVLTGEGLLWPCSQTKLVVSGAPASAPGFLAYGMSSAPTPFLGGTLMPDVTPPGGLLPFGTDPGGSLTLGAPWHPALPSGLALTLQAWIYDPTTTRFAATNALVATSP